MSDRTRKRVGHGGKEKWGMGKEGYATSSQKLSHTSWVLACSLVYFMYGISVIIGRIVTS